MSATSPGHAHIELLGRIAEEGLLGLIPGDGSNRKLEIVVLPPISHVAWKPDVHPRNGSKGDFQSWIDSPCPTKKRLGHDLMRPTKAMVALWRRVRDGTRSHADSQTQMQSIRVEINALILRGSCNALTQSVCRELFERRACLWHFVDHADIEPTNNAAEQALRHAVIWRKLRLARNRRRGAGSWSDC